MTSLSADERRALILSVGTHKGKRPLSPVEVARLVQRMLDQGATATEVAELVQFDGTTMIGRFQRLLKLSPDIQHLVDFGTGAGSLGFTAAFEMARLPSSDHQELASAILQNQLASAEVRQVTQLRLRTRRPIRDCVQEVVGMRPETIIRHLYVGAILDKGLQDRLKPLTQLQRNEHLSSALAKRCPSLRVTTARLGTDRFTLVGGADLGAAAQGTLEHDVNEELAARLP